MRSRLSLGVALLAVSLAPARASAAVTLLEQGDTTLTLGGYARTLGGVQRIRVEDSETAKALGLPNHVGINASVLRAEWTLSVGPWATVEVHNRLYLQVLSEASQAAGAMGIGVTRAPRRWLDVRHAVYEDSRLQLEHDLDRLVARLYLGPLDVTVGRQAISWGTSLLFPVADVWAPFSPFELDTSQKRGIDALRMLTTVADGAERELVVADRGSLRDLSGGARLTWYAPFGDLYGAVGKLWNEGLFAAGVSKELDTFKLRGEGALPLDLDRGELLLPRVTLGVDWFRPELVLGLEAHYNGSGVWPDRYLEHAATSAVVSRGEAYLLGRWYLGLVTSWQPSELVSVAGSVIANLRDPSAVGSLALTYKPSQDAALTVGVFQGFGKPPRLDPPSIASEMGSFGGLYYAELAAFF